MLEYFRELGRSRRTFRDLRSSCKIILGSTRKYFKGAGEIWALFSGSKGALTPTGNPLGGPLKCRQRSDILLLTGNVSLTLTKYKEEEQIHEIYDHNTYTTSKHLNYTKNIYHLFLPFFRQSNKEDKTTKKNQIRSATLGRTAMKL